MSLFNKFNNNHMKKDQLPNANTAVSPIRYIVNCHYRCCRKIYKLYFKDSLKLLI